MNSVLLICLLVAIALTIIAINENSKKKNDLSVHALPKYNPKIEDIAERTSKNIHDEKADYFLNASEVSKAEIIRLVDRHGRVLVSKFNQSIRTDDYGNRFCEKWVDELNYFIDNVLTREFGDSPFGFDNIELRSIIWDRVIDLSMESLNAENINIDNLSPIEFESYCKDILEKSGWNARLTKGSGDQGVDIVAEKNGMQIAIQCKKYSNPVGNGAVQEIVAGRIHYNANIGIVVTNTTYTPSAKALAKTNGVILLHYTDLNAIDGYLST